MPTHRPTALRRHQTTHQPQQTTATRARTATVATCQAGALRHRWVSVKPSVARAPTYNSVRVRHRRVSATTLWWAVVHTRCGLLACCCLLQQQQRCNEHQRQWAGERRRRRIRLCFGHCDACLCTVVAYKLNFNYMSLKPKHKAFFWCVYCEQSNTNCQWQEMPNQSRYDGRTRIQQNCRCRRSTPNYNANRNQF